MLGFASLYVTMAGLFIANMFLGVVLPTAQVLALEEQGEHAGLAASLGGTMQMVAAGVLVAATGPLMDGTVVPMLGAIALCGADCAGAVAADPASRGSGRGLKFGQSGVQHIQAPRRVCWRAPTAPGAIRARRVAR